MQKRINLKIYGRVQGISFRGASKIKAKTLGLSGWVRNEPDGTVQVVAKGEEEKLKEMIEKKIKIRISNISYVKKLYTHVVDFLTLIL